MRRLPRLLPLALLFVCFLGAPDAARAEEVVITSGFVQLGGAFPPGRGTFRTISFNFASTAFNVSGGDPDGAQQHVQSGCAFVPCAVGAQVSADSAASLQQNLAGNAVVFGNSYSPAFFFGSSLVFNGVELVIPPGGADTLMLTTLFEMTGTLNIQGPSPGTQVFSMLVRGSGLATLTLQQFMGGYVLTTIRYDFAPAAVPEPATLLLLGTGLAGIAAARRRRRTRTAV